MKRILLSLALCALAATPAFADGTTINGPRVVVPAHDIARGEVIADSDLTIATITPDRMRPGVVQSVAALTGHEARRMLRAGEPIRADDVRMPILVAKGSTVTMTFDVPGITLTATGKAMTEGGLGESVVVENPVSFRQVSCVVTGAGMVRAGDAAPVSVPQLAENP